MTAGFAVFWFIGVANEESVSGGDGEPSLVTPVVLIERLTRPLGIEKSEDLALCTTILRYPSAFGPFSGLTRKQYLSNVRV